MELNQMQAKKILTGNVTSSQLGFSMLLTRLRGVFSKDPSPATLQSCTNEINAFIKKYSSVMAPELAALSKL